LVLAEVKLTTGPRNPSPDPAMIRLPLDWAEQERRYVVGADLMDKATIRGGLDACLVPAKAFTSERRVRLPDSFPRWEAA